MDSPATAQEQDFPEPPALWWIHSILGVLQGKERTAITPVTIVILEHFLQLAVNVSLVNLDHFPMFLPLHLLVIVILVQLGNTVQS
jgi:hypothetical protein